MQWLWEVFIHAFWAIFGIYHGPEKDLGQWEDLIGTRRTAANISAAHNTYESFANKFSRILQMSAPEGLEVNSSALSSAQGAEGKPNAVLTECWLQHLREGRGRARFCRRQQDETQKLSHQLTLPVLQWPW